MQRGTDLVGMQWSCRVDFLVSEQRVSPRHEERAGNAEGSTASENQQQQQRTARQRVKTMRVCATWCMPIPYGIRPRAGPRVPFTVRGNGVQWTQSVDHHWGDHLVGRNHDDVRTERISGARRCRRTATRQRHQDRPPAVDDHPALAAAPAELGAGRGRYLPGQPGGQPRAGGHPRRGGRRHRGAAAADLRRLRDQPARIHAALDLHAARRAHPGVRPVLQPARPDRPAAAADHRDDQGTPGVRAGQQPGVRPARAGHPGADHQDPQRRAHPR